MIKIKFREIFNLFLFLLFIFIFLNFSFQNYINLSKQRTHIYGNNIYNEPSNCLSNLYSKNNFLEYYFYNLTQNLGDNISNACFFVGITMILSYFDTYYNDNIIPELYDMNGTLLEDDIKTINYLTGVQEYILISLMIIFINLIL